MRKLENLSVGWIDTSVRAVTEAGLLSRFASVLVTSIDSTTSLAASAIGNRITAFDPECMFLGLGVLIPGRLIVRVAATMDLFNGFDELWCFEHLPTTPKPNDLWIVSPFNMATDLAPANLTSWMAEADCRLALGDGIGLNFVTPQVEIATILEHLAE